MVKDHLGKSYQSVKEMCSAYNISYAVFLDRRSLGWSLEDCLTVKVVDHKGRGYKSEEEMCNYWGVKYYVFKDRLSENWTLEEALES